MVGLHHVSVCPQAAARRRGNMQTGLDPSRSAGSQAKPASQPANQRLQAVAAPSHTTPPGSTCRHSPGRRALGTGRAACHPAQALLSGGWPGRRPCTTTPPPAPSAAAAEGHRRCRCSTPRAPAAAPAGAAAAVDGRPGRVPGGTAGERGAEAACPTAHAARGLLSPPPPPPPQPPRGAPPRRSAGG